MSDAMFEILSLSARYVMLGFVALGIFLLLRGMLRERKMEGNRQPNEAWLRLPYVAVSYTHLDVYKRQGFEPAANQRDALNYIGQHIGRWVYLIDALDDLERDIKGGTYNVLTLRYGYEPGQPPAQFRRQAAEQVGVLLNLNLAYAAKGFDMLYLERNQPILENLFFLGLKTITQNIIDGRRQTDDRSLQGTGGI